MARLRIPRAIIVLAGVLLFQSAMCMALEVHLHIKPFAISESLCGDVEPCLTLEQFSKNATQYSDSNTSLILELLPGNHRLSSTIKVQSITLLKNFSRAKNVSIICTDVAGFILIKIATVEFAFLTFHGCGSGKSWREGAALRTSYCKSVYLKECHFHNSKNIIIFCHHCNITTYRNEFSNSSINAVLYAFHCNITDTKSYYGDNTRNLSVNAIYIRSSYCHFNFCKFDRNGPLLKVTYATLILFSCEINENNANRAVFDAYSSNVTFVSSHIFSNTGLQNALCFQGCNVILKNYTTIIQNEAYFGPVLLLRKTILVTYDDVIIAGNIPWNYSANIRFEEGTKSNITGKLIIKNNKGYFSISNSKVRFYNITMFLNNSNSNSRLSNVSTIHEAGAIACSGSTIRFMASVIFRDNYSRKNGGAISASGSKIYVHENITVSKNQAYGHGGGIYLFVSHFICEIFCNFSENHAMSGHGGGIHAVDSIAFLGGECDECVSNKSLMIIFKNNSAIQGGGIYFEVNSELRGPKDCLQKYKIIFDNNYAFTEGKAIYVNDNTYLATCSQHNAQCFLQTSPPGRKDCALQGKQIKFVGNINKTTIFGGLLDKCIVNNAFSDKNSMTGIAYLKAVTGYDITRSITSNPVRMCSCVWHQPNCTSLYESTYTIAVQRGQNFNVTVVAVDQVNNSVNALIFSDLKFQDSYLGTNQSYQRTLAECTNLTFNVYSYHDHETLTILPDGQCLWNRTPLRMHLVFKNCSCPAGFYIDKHNKTSCECECDSKINPFKKGCNLSFVDRNNRGTQGWISYDMNTGFLFHSFCPYDFCYPPDTAVSIDLTLLNGSDAQCALNRTGLLCGRCKPGYSLSLSSSCCIRCPEVNWPWALMIVTVKIIAGVVLVVVILILNLTVSTGTLNGLIFYANILVADTSLFLSFTKPNFLTVFIAWLNLDLGFDVCYFKGIDAYSKAWLNILFPTYVITVLLLIILISKYSSRFGELIGKWNPVATLATLLLLSYTKLLRAIITVLSFTVITYPTGRWEIAWLQDASVKFFGLKHFPLGLLAIAIITVGFIYTVLLFSWQWILRLPNKRIFRWARNTRLNLFVEANLAPYKAKYRYWYGLLLLVRMALYLGIATEKSHESVTIVLAIGLIAASVLLLRTFLGNNVYRNRFIGYLNSSFYYNLLALSLARLFCQDTTSCQEISSIISIALAFILFVFILSYHILCALLEIRRFRHLIGSIEQMLNLRKLKIRLIDDPRFKNIQESELQEASVVTVPTSTEVTLSPCKDSSDVDKRGGKSANKNFTDGECSSVKNEETKMNDSIDNENICEQKTYKRGKQWTNSNTLREPLLQD